MNFNGVEAVDSRQVAEAVGKEHNKLLRDIRIYCEYLGESKIGHSDFFIESTYTDGKVLFCGKDVAVSLGYTNPLKAVRDHCKEEGVNEMDTPTAGGKQTMKFITEGNVYRLITHSKLPTAERFESWVFDEVLRQFSLLYFFRNFLIKVRKGDNIQITGYYILPLYIYRFKSVN